MKLVLCAMLMITLCAFSNVRAEEELAPGFNDCAEKAVSTYDNLDCLGAAYKHWDKILNANYKKAKESCKDSDHPKQCSDNLLKAQRLWIQYKEAMIPVIEELEGGGSLSRLSANEFAASETKKQAKLLAPQQ